jgi:putative addiction module antidote
MLALKISRVGNSAALLLTKEALALLRVEQGDTVYLTEAPDGYRITTYEPDFEHDMKLARRIMRKRKNVLRELAK